MEPRQVGQIRRRLELFLVDLERVVGKFDELSSVVTGKKRIEVN